MANKPDIIPDIQGLIGKKPASLQGVPVFNMAPEL
jgi:hypothetical protein